MMPIDDASLNALRLVGDPPVDALVQALGATGAGAVGRLFGTLVATDGPLPPGLPPAMVAHFKAASAWPTWGDRALVRRGERVFAKYGPELVAGLFCAALPQCYANHRGVAVLTMTGRMQGTAIDRRIMETAQFLCDIVDEGGLYPGGRGISTVQKVRLMHAGIRTLVLQGNGQSSYDVASRGVPICQEDLAFTLMSFSVVLLDGLAATGITVSPADREAWVHLWRIVGHFIGLQDSANPASYAEAQAFSAAYRVRNFGPSADGTQLMDALMGFMKRLVPGTLLDGFPAAFVRCMGGHALADQLGVEEAVWPTRLVKLEIKAVRVLDRLLPGGIGIVPGVGTWFDELVRAIAVASRGGKQAQFRVPRHLQGERGGVRRGKKRNDRSAAAG